MDGCDEFKGEMVLVFPAEMLRHLPRRVTVTAPYDQFLLSMIEQLLVATPQAQRGNREAAERLQPSIREQYDVAGSAPLAAT
jgi:hypothetical protein